MESKRVIAIAAHPITLAAGSAVTAAILHEHRGVAERLAIAFPIGFTASKLLKRAFPRRKPRLLSLQPLESFPSGHTTATTLFAASLIDGLRAYRPLPIAAGIAAIATVAASRVRAREHRVSEVLAGIALGMAAAGIAAAAARAIERKISSRRAESERT